ncbi:restriction endonuclease subunit S [Nonomuraea sp. NPDC004297]
MTPAELPSGWAPTTLGEIAHYQNGRGFKKSEWSDSGRPIVRIQNLTGSGAAFNCFSGDLDERHIVRTGDLLISWAATLGAFIWDGPEGALNQHIFKVTPFIDKKFLYYLVQHALEDLYSHTHGSGMVHITKEKFDTLPVAIPPLREQQRIVSALEEHLVQLDTGKTSINTAIKRSKGLAQLIADHELSRFSDRPTAPLGEMIREPLRNGHSARATNGSFGIRTLTLTAVTKGRFVDEFTKLTSADPNRVANLWLKSGDILIERSNTSDLVGTSAVYNGPDEWAIFPDLLIRVRVNDGLLPEYVGLVLSTSSAMRYFQRSAKGLSGSMPKIDQGVIERTSIPLIPLDEQKELVSRVSEQRAQVERLTGTASAMGRRAVQLRGAILASAFSGHLVPQDPADEPASVLLERLQSKKVAKPKARRGSRTKNKSVGTQEDLLL